MDNIFNISPEIIAVGEQALSDVRPQFERIDSITEYNQNKVLKAFIDNRVSESCFAGSTGYGNTDHGRDVLERAFAQIVGTEDAILRVQFMSGTHTLTVGLFGILRPGDTMLSVVGEPYDTLHGVIGISGEKGSGSLIDFGVKFEQVDLLDGEIDYDAISRRLSGEFVKVVYIQRSRGYAVRNSLSIETVEKICKLVRSVSPDSIIMVDNCYCEYVSKKEPTEVGADIIMGSMIKNPGGGIAPTGGYIAGRADLVELCANRLTAPGIGNEIGATLNVMREFYLGTFNAPHAVGEAVKTAVYAARVFELLGFDVDPKYTDVRADIVQTVILRSADALVSFCCGIQAASPVDAFARPEPSDMAGYDDQVVMAAGTFTLGSTIEFSADGPLREPYAAWMQGGINFHSAKTGILLSAESMKNAGISMKL